MSIIGKYANLKVAKLVDFGVYLEGEQEELILLPKRYVPKNVQIDDSLRVFIYRDSEDRVIATTLHPEVEVGQCAYLRVKSVDHVGAFLDWGLPKDLLVPFNEQKKDMQVGRSYLVYVYLDEKSGRIAATAKLEKAFKNNNPKLLEGQEVEVLIGRQTELGYIAVINNECLGILYQNEIFGEIREGEIRTAYIKKIRSDGKIDLSLQRQGYQKEIPEAGNQILELLKKKNGFLPITDKSSPDEIYKMLNMSKKNFKKAVGLLYKQRIIRIEKNGIYINE